MDDNKPFDINYVLRVYKNFRYFEDSESYSRKPLIETQQIVDVIVKYAETGELTQSDEVLVKALESELIWTKYRLDEIRDERENRWYKKLWRKITDE